MPWPRGDPRDLARDILRGGAYRDAAQTAGRKTWLDYLLEAIDRAWHWLTDPLKNVHGGSTIATIVGAVVLIGAVALLTFTIVRFTRTVTLRRAPHAARANVESLVSADARTLLARALDAAAAGRYREAAALLWGSALRALDERGRVAYDPARTPGEWRRAVRDPQFDGFSRDAVIALFGDGDVDAALVGRMRAAYDRVLAR